MSKQDFLFSRRFFLKGSAYLGASLSLFGLTGCSPSKLTSLTQEAQSGNVTQSLHVCARNCFDGQCSFLVDKVDGRAVRMVGDKTNPYTAGTPCVKGHTHINMLYHPDRLLYPMKRAGKKGEGKWERISWDEAYDTIVAKMKEAIAKYGPEAIMPYNFSGTVGFVQQFSMPWRFFHKLGATKITRTVCNTGGMEALQYTYGDFSSLDPETFVKTKLYVSWGANEPNSNVHMIKFVKQARENGAKMIVVNPHRTALASQADMFIQPRMGTDAALALGVQHVIINENLYDKEFVEKYTLGFDQLKEKVQQFPPKRVAEICGITEEEIVTFARTFASIKPSIVKTGLGIQRRTNGGSMIRAISFLPALVGTVGMDGGGFSYVNYWNKPYDFNALMRPDLLPDKKVRVINMNQLGKALNGEIATTKQKPIKVLFNFNGNPLPSAPNINLVKKGLQREDLFTVVYDVYVTDTADYADIILPAPHCMEQEDVFADWYAYYVRYNAPIHKPLGESRPNAQVFSELAKRMGFTDALFDETFESMLKTCNKNMPIHAHVTYEALKEKCWLKIDTGIAYRERKFKTPSGKIEFYSELMAKKGFDPVADYVPDKEGIEKAPELYSKYPIHLTTPCCAQLLNGQWHNEPYLQEIIGEPTITINVEDAKSRGIKEGDYVRVFNDRGEVKLKAKLTKAAVKPGTAMSYKSHWEKYVNGQTINKLALDEVGDMGGISTFYSLLVQINKV